MLAPGITVILSKAAFTNCTIYNNRYSREGNTNTMIVSQSIIIAAGTTIKLVRRK